MSDKQNMKYVSDLVFRMNQSPFRKVNLAIRMDQKEELQNILNEVKGYKVSGKGPVKVVVMGEVKAGKSTFINSIVGQEVSRMDVLEATALIYEISHGEEESCCIHMNNDESIAGSLKQIRAIIKSKKEDDAFIKQCNYVEIKVPTSKLRDIYIVDTPGIATITGENEQTTKDYIKNADVVLWLFNGNYLGQADINKEFIEIAKLGKPMVAIINRVDEVEDQGGNRDGLVKHYKKDLGMFTKKVFTLSAKQGLDGVMNNNLKLQELSGYIAIKEYLLNDVERNAPEIKDKAVNSSVKNLGRRELLYHKSALNLLEERQRKLNELTRLVESASFEVEMRVETIINDWQRNFLKAEECQILSSINDKSFINHMFAGNSDILEEGAQLLSERQMQQYMYHLFEEARKEFDNSWSEKLMRLQYDIDSINDEFKEYADKSESSYQIVHRNQYIDHIATVKENTKNIAIYSAGVVGTGALLAATLPTGLTFGAAVGAVMPPVLIVGAVGGLAFSYVNYKDDKRAMESQISRRFIEVRDHHGKKAADNMRKEIKSDNAKKAKELMKLVGSQPYDKNLNDLIVEVKNYMIKIEGLELEYSHE